MTNRPLFDVSLMASVSNEPNIATHDNTLTQALWVASQPNPLYSSILLKPFAISAQDLRCHGNVAGLVLQEGALGTITISHLGTPCPTKVRPLIKSYMRRVRLSVPEGDSG